MTTLNSKYSYEFACPHCGFKNKRTMNNTLTQRNVTHCDVDEGGCDEMVAVEASVTTTVNVTTYKLNQSEWQE